MGIYWSIQTKQAWDAAQFENVLQGHKEYATTFLHDEYLWMMEQMGKRLPAYNGGYPIWVWTERPDLRHSAHLPRGTEGVLLKLELDDSLVLLSDFDAWHSVLNDCFCAINEAEWDTFYEGALSVTKEASWERIFDLDIVRQDESWSGTEWRTQGVVETVPLSSVLDVRSFIAR